MLPIYQPPTLFAVRPNQAVDSIDYMEGAKIFVRICLPKNSKLNYKIKRQDQIVQDYESSPMHELVGTYDCVEVPSNQPV